MKYRFNDRIIFDADAGALSLSDLFDEPVVISNPSKRLLQLLIAYQGNAVSREVIFKHVWDDYGMISSNNNLNQCVSKLRRVIKTLGIDDEVIVTVPKVGFMLRSEVHVALCEEEEYLVEQPVEHLVGNSADYLVEHPADYLVVHAVESPNDSVEPTVSVSKHVSITRSLRKFMSPSMLRYGCGVLGFILVVAIGIALYTYTPLSRQETYLGKVGNCSVFMLSSTVSTDARVVSDILAYAERQKVQCGADEYLLIIRSNQSKSYLPGISRLFFIRCKLLREHRVEICTRVESGSLPLVE